jgi:hypothetical protein
VKESRFSIGLGPLGCPVPSGARQGIRSGPPHFRLLNSFEDILSKTRTMLRVMACESSQATGRKQEEDARKGDESPCGFKYIARDADKRSEQVAEKREAEQSGDEAIPKIWATRPPVRGAELRKRNPIVSWRKRPKRLSFSGDGDQVLARWSNWQVFPAYGPAPQAEQIGTNDVRECNEG